MPKIVNPRAPRAPLARRVYSIDEVSEVLQLTRATVYNMMKRDELRYLTIGGRRRVLVEDLDRILASGQ